MTARSREVDCDTACSIDRLDLATREVQVSYRRDPAVRVAGALSEIADQAPSMAACGLVLAAGLAAERPRLAKADPRMLAAVLVADGIVELAAPALDRAAERDAAA